VRTETSEQAYKAAMACIEGGIKFIEITFSVPDADDVIRRLASDIRVTVGAGTILNFADAKKALNAGAKYIVSPNFDEDVVRFTKKEGIISIPGASTPTEIYRAYTAGGDIIKLFPFVEIGYLAARAAGILVGSAIIKRELVKTENWKTITELAGIFVDRTKSETNEK